jgi:hypothetical protein
MKVQLKLILGIAAALLIIGVTGSLVLTQSRVDTALQTGNTTGSPVAQAGGELRGPSELPHSGTLNTVDYALSVVKDKVVVPNASRIGPNYKIIGVEIRQTPQNDTTSNGITFRNWILLFVISDKPFINGTTLNTELAGHIVTVGEAVSTGYYNSHDAAVTLMEPYPVCITDLKTGNQTCSAPSNPNSGELVQIRDTYLVVHPEVPNAYFSIDGVNRQIDIWGDSINYQQLLSLADSMIP